MATNLPALVFAVALRAEIPREALQAAGIPVIRPLKNLPTNGMTATRGMAVVISGPGPDAAAATARWLRQQTGVRHVLNIGGCGNPDKRYSPGTWTMPARTATPGSRPLDLPGALPLPLPPTLQKGMRRGDTLITSSVPVYSPDRLPEGTALVDMEAAAWAAVLSENESGISFHCLKMVTDSAGSDAATAFRRSLPLLHRGFAECLPEPAAEDISVVIPVHNRPDQVERAIASVHSQTHPAREIIVVDDGSDDETADRLQAMGTRIRSLRMPQNAGVSAARNLGIAKAAGSFVAFLDSDDEGLPRHLADLHAHAAAHPWQRIMQTGEIWMRDGRRVNPGRRHRQPEGWIARPSLDLCLISPSAVMIHRETLLKEGAFDEDLPACEDYDLWLRLTPRYPVGLIKEPSVVRYGGHPDQLSGRFPAMDRFRIKALLKARQSWPREIRPDLDQVLRRKAAIVAAGCRKRGRLDEAVRYEEIITGIDTGTDLPPAPMRDHHG